MVVVGLEQAKGMEEKEMERRRGEIDDGAGCEEAAVGCGSAEYRRLVSLLAVRAVYCQAAR